jgi:hypothetical protein
MTPDAIRSLLQTYGVRTIRITNDDVLKSMASEEQIVALVTNEVTVSSGICDSSAVRR